MHALQRGHGSSRDLDLDDVTAMGTSGQGFARKPKPPETCGARHALQHGHGSSRDLVVDEDTAMGKSGGKGFASSAQMLQRDGQSLLGDS
uniref:Uncharacterized protein n=1 Tax=Tetradesmus obliquus TaxID=3088 RepID=A0A383VL48_TETOB